MSRNRYSLSGLVLLTTTLGACSSPSKLHSPEAGVDSDLSGDPVPTYDSGTEDAQLPDASVARDVQPQDLYTVDTQEDGNPVDVDCSAGYLSNANNTCEPLPGCNGMPLLGCACGLSGDTACNAAVRPNKVPLVCQGGLWILNGGSCSSTQNCDWNDGLCKPIVGACAGQNPGDAFCAYSSGITAYKDVRKTCGPDLVTISDTLTCSGVCVPNQGCLNPICGDGKVEGFEECDDGNTMALDGCEPATAPSGEACVKSKILSVSAGAAHTCGVFKGGYARCWGANESNQLGLGHTQFEGDLKPYQLIVFDSGGNPVPAGPIDFGGIAVDSISAGSDFSCALLADQSIRCWGKNTSGQLGLGNTNSYSTATPSALGSISLGGSAKSVVAGNGSACAQLTTGAVRCWGANDSAQLATGTTDALSSQTPAQIAANTTAYPNWISLGGTASAISLGGSTACALLSDSLGTIRCWGSNGFGQLGVSQSTQLSKTQVPSAYSAVLVPSGKTATSISVGGSSVCTHFSDGTAECWGSNSSGQLGLGTTVAVGAYSSPAAGGQVAVPAGGVDSIFMGLGVSTCAYYSGGGGFHCWGDNSKGQLGYPDTTNRGNTSGTTPNNLTAVPAINFGSGVTATALSLGSGHACAILSTGALHCWGYNYYGQLGLGFTSTGSPDYVGGSATTTPDNAVTSVQLFP
jgi:cysteine-rich repeat protein